MVRENISSQSSAVSELRKRRAFFLLEEIGWNPLKTASFANGLARYIFQFIRFRARSKKANINQHLKISPILSDYAKEAGDSKSLYFLQDLSCSQYVLDKAPGRHIDVGSRLDGFIAQICASRPIEVMDIRPNETQIKNIHFTQADICKLRPELAGSYDLVTSLHALEHIGLGRYGDPIDPNGFTKGLENCRRLAKSQGEVLISLPIASTARDTTEFNAQRIFSSRTILETLAKSFVNDDLKWWCACDSSRRPISGSSTELLRSTLNEFRGVGFLATSWQKK